MSQSSDCRKNDGGGREIRQFFQRHISVILLSICISALFALVVVSSKFLDPVHRAIGNFSFTDIYYGIIKEISVPDTSRIVTIVDMTQLTSRTDIATLLAEIEIHNPKLIGLDVCFDNEGEDFAGNDSLIAVASKYANIVYSMKLFEWENDSIGWAKCIHSFFHEIIPLTEGVTNVPRTLYDNTKRSISLYERFEGKLLPSFAMQISSRYAERDLMGERTEDVKVDFSPTVFRTILPEQVSNHPELVEDQIVLVGAVYEEIDRHWTPAGKISGVELQAYGIHSIIYGKEIKDLPAFMLCIISLMVIFLVEVIQHWYLDAMTHSNRIFVRYILGSTYVMNILTFLFTSVFLGIGYLLFKVYGLSINLAWAFSVITFFGTSRHMCNALTNYFKAQREQADSRYNSIKNRIHISRK